MRMIHLTRLDGKPFVINCELIQTVDETPDTVLTLVNGERFVVTEDADEVITRVIAYRRKAYGPLARRER